MQITMNQNTNFLNILEQLAEGFQKWHEENLAEILQTNNIEKTIVNDILNAFTDTIDNQLVQDSTVDQDLAPLNNKVKAAVEKSAPGKTEELISDKINKQLQDFNKLAQKITDKFPFISPILYPVTLLGDAVKTFLTYKNYSAVFKNIYFKLPKNLDTVIKLKLLGCSIGSHIGESYCRLFLAKMNNAFPSSIISLSKNFLSLAVTAKMGFGTAIIIGSLAGMQDALTNKNKKDMDFLKPLNEVFSRKTTLLDKTCDYCRKVYEAEKMTLKHASLDAVNLVKQNKACNNFLGFIASAASNKTKKRLGQLFEGIVVVYLTVKELALQCVTKIAMTATSSIVKQIALAAVKKAPHLIQTPKMAPQQKNIK